MFKYYCHIIFCFFIFKNSIAQPIIGKSAEARFYYKEAQKFMKIKNYDSAIDYFRECVSLEKTNPIFHRDYAMAFLANKEYGKAALIIEKALDFPDADESVFQLAGIIFNTKADCTLCKKSLDKGLEIFPNSPILLFTKAEFLYTYKDDKKAIALFKRAMSLDSTMYTPYYFLAKISDTNTTELYSTIANAENFILHEPYTSKSAEMKKLLFDCYKIAYRNMFDKNNNLTASTKKNLNNNPEALYLNAFKTNKYIWMDGYNIDNFINIRTTVLNDWVWNHQASKTPKFILYQNLLKEDNLFDTYNQWLLGVYFSQTNFTKWATANASALNRLNQTFLDKPIKNIQLFN